MREVHAEDCGRNGEFGLPKSLDSQGSDAFFFFCKPSVTSFVQVENSFSVSVPIFKQFHRNIIGKGGSNIKKVPCFPKNLGTKAFEQN